MLIDAHVHIFPKVDGYGPKGHTHGAGYGRIDAGDGIAQDVLHLCHSGVADLIVQTACTVAVPLYGMGAVGHIAHLAQPRQLCPDGFAVGLIIRLLDQTHLLPYCKGHRAVAVVQAGQCYIILHGFTSLEILFAAVAAVCIAVCVIGRNAVSAVRAEIALECGHVLGIALIAGAEVAKIKIFHRIILRKCSCRSSLPGDVRPSLCFYYPHLQSNKKDFRQIISSFFYFVFPARRCRLCSVPTAYHTLPGKRSTAGRHSAKAGSTADSSPSFCSFIFAKKSLTFGEIL